MDQTDLLTLTNSEPSHDKDREIAALRDTIIKMAGRDKCFVARTEVTFVEDHKIEVYVTIPTVAEESDYGLSLACAHIAAKAIDGVLGKVCRENRRVPKSVAASIKISETGMVVIPKLIIDPGRALQYASAIQSAAVAAEKIKTKKPKTSGNTAPASSEGEEGKL